MTPREQFDVLKVDYIQKASTHFKLIEESEYDSFFKIGTKGILAQAHLESVRSYIDLIRHTSDANVTSHTIRSFATSEREEEFRAFLQASSNVIYKMSADWKVMRSLIGKDFLTTTSTNLSWLQTYIPEKEREFVSQAIDTAIRNKSTFDLQHRVIRKDGTIGWAHSRAIPLFDERGEIKEWFGTASDISRAMELEHQKEDFLGIASHELKTPVTVIKAYTHLLQQLFEQKDDQVSADYITKLNGQVDRLKRLIGDLLDTTQISEGQLSLKLEKFNIKEMITGQMYELQKLSPDHIMILDSCSAIVLADSERVTQVLTNLISNAIKYSPGGSDIIIVCEEKGNDIQISVKDTGIGIEKELQEKVFERFFRIQEHRSPTYPGMGLGLYITAGIIKRHNGKIWLESEVGKGSTFYFTLPLYRDTYSE